MKKLTLATLMFAIASGLVAAPQGATTKKGSAKAPPVATTTTAKDVPAKAPTKGKAKAKKSTKEKAPDTTHK
ncbi:MAG: hypothetical protein ABI811_23245 [Acidobacteriota bacterium]